VKASQRWLEFEHHKSARYDEGTSRFFAWLRNRKRTLRVNLKELLIFSTEKVG
jgi:hypothetical protein